MRRVPQRAEETLRNDENAKSPSKSRGDSPQRWGGCEGVKDFKQGR